MTFNSMDDVYKVIFQCYNECKDKGLINFVENRWGQDVKYAIDCSKLRALAWKPQKENLFKWF